MKRSAFITGILITIALAAGCTASPEQRLAEGLSEVRMAFEKEPPRTNETIGQTKLYLPVGSDIEKPTEENNFIITKGSESYVLFTNPNESADSRLFYNLQKMDTEQEWLADETFEQNNRFGFVTLRQIAEDQVEVMVSAGGVKMTTIIEESEVPGSLEWMMKTVRSAE